MQVRRFEATTMKDALAAVKRELGNSAVILSTKEIADGHEGIRLYEVTAASSVSTNKAGAETGKQNATADFAFGPELLSRLTELNEIMPTRNQMRLLEGAVSDVKTMLLESLRNQSEDAKIPGHLFPIDRAFKSALVDEAIIAEAMRHLHTLPPPAEIARTSNDSVETYYRDQAIRWMMKRIKISPKWSATPGITNVHAFIGTPGCGKTTLLAKIATAIHKKDRHKVAIITYDPEKVAAAEQVRIYAKILGVPHVSIASPHELKKTVLGMKNVDIVLLDMPGRNPNDSKASAEVDLIKELGLSLDFHLVISAAEKLTVSQRAVSAFSSAGIASIAITKLDESPSYGEVFTLTSKWSLPISYFAHTNELSAGVERATRERIIERIFNL